MVYFAYGSNLNLKQMKKRCPESIPMVKVILKDYKLGYNKYADIVPFQGECVHGAIYEVSLNDLKALDKYEDYPRLYNKVDLKVQDDKGVSYEAFSYIMVSRRTELPNDSYISIIEEGYQDWGIPVAILPKAK